MVNEDDHMLSRAAQRAMKLLIGLAGTGLGAILIAILLKPSDLPEKSGLVLQGLDWTGRHLSAVTGVFAGFAVGIVAVNLIIRWDQERHRGRRNAIGDPYVLAKQENVKFVIRCPEFSHEDVCKSLKTYGYSSDLSLIGESLAAGIVVQREAISRRILVTSLGEGEGKSTLAFCLGKALAQMEYTTLIVDCDLKRGRQHKIVEQAGDGGLSKILYGEASIQTFPTPLSKLSVVFCGPVPPSSAALLGSERARKVFADFAENHEFIVMDAPPCLEIADVPLLVPYCDIIVLVIEAHRWLPRQINHQIKRLQIGDKPIIAVLNKMKLGDFDGESHFFGYSYYMNN